MPREFLVLLVVVVLVIGNGQSRTRTRTNWFRLRCAVSNGLCRPLVGRASLRFLCRQDAGSTLWVIERRRRNGMRAPRALPEARIGATNVIAFMASSLKLCGVNAIFAILI